MPGNGFGTRDHDRARRRILAVAMAAVTLGLVHHAEHVVRGDVGWPFGADVNPFTYSLFIYPAALTAIAVTLRGPLVAALHASLGAAGLVLVGVSHLGPAAGDPIARIYEHHAATSPLAGAIALAIVVGLLASLAALVVVALQARAAERVLIGPPGVPDVRPARVSAK